MTASALLALEDGTCFFGRSFGSEGESHGEVVFNTSMTGYPEILTDPSYCGQMVCMTYPLIGNYGITAEDFESRRIFLSGWIVKENSRTVSNWRSQRTLADFLKEYDIVAIEGIDTRRLVKHIRLAGAMKGMLSTVDLDQKSLVAKAKASPGLIGRDLVSEVAREKPYEWSEPLTEVEPRRPEFSVVALDYGIKQGILRSLVSHGCKVTVLPPTTKAERILAYDPDGILLSNGPGDPAALPRIVDEVKKLLGRKPMFGICLGHQILSLALEGKTFKLKFGHHGGNHPVQDLCTGKVAITSQNHGFCVDADSLPADQVEITHINLNDQTLEGFRHKTLPLFSVQYHPEASPGPRDSRYLFDEFVTLMKSSHQIPAMPIEHRPSGT